MTEYEKRLEATNPLLYAEGLRLQSINPKVAVAYQKTAAMNWQHLQKVRQNIEIWVD